VRAWGFDDTLVFDDRELTRFDLDRAGGGHPGIGFLPDESVFLRAVGLGADRQQRASVFHYGDITVMDLRREAITRGVKVRNVEA
jgi:hypothetical protein